MDIPQIIELLSDDFFLLNDAKNIEMHIKALSVDNSSIQSKLLSYPPATNDSIAKKEKSLDVKLPPSYKEFLLFSNGLELSLLFWITFFQLRKLIGQGI